MIVVCETNVLPVIVAMLCNLQNNCYHHLQTIVCGFLIFYLMVHMAIPSKCELCLYYRWLSKARNHPAFFCLPHIGVMLMALALDCS